MNEQQLSISVYFSLRGREAAGDAKKHFGEKFKIQSPSDGRVATAAGNGCLRLRRNWEGWARRGGARGPFSGSPD